MVIIELGFPSGRFHATPWGHNVNEGVVEWPPSPYRIARALVDVWKRRRPDWPVERVEPILQALCTLPSFYLPPASASHTRSYLNSNERNTFAQQLIFDAFVAVGKEEKLLMGIDSDLSPDAVGDLNELLSELNYLGRSESWISCRAITDHHDVQWNCVPLTEQESKGRTETVQVSCVLSPEDHARLPYKPESETWLNALCMTSKDILTKGWSAPPAMLRHDYARPVNALQPSLRKKRKAPKRQFRCVRYQLQSSVLPRVQETVQFAERIRGHLMGIHKKIHDDDPSQVSQIFSGKGDNGKKLEGHRHAFYLPLDEDGDGRIDHLMVVAAEPFNVSELKAMDRLRAVWQSKGRPDVNIILLSMLNEPEAKLSRTWVSATPFVTARHYRKGRGSYEEWVENEIVRECAFHGIPEPSEIQFIDRSIVGRPIRWMEFCRSRKNGSTLRGVGCILTFDKPVPGPFHIGALCHFGLGRFVVMDE
ncbi:type I-U CRISPR-associated protein Csb2 [uncultured Desulfosarcina sp.]|uniref:type I-G CRISPR-associated protein Csb2 n=1 Tax=uncultured Desulfosarcina sp. TaxID=218289 RepID=UPI0029C8940A|nr:type I-U CRISPR-associated protein Csb2 [uncultured Desulfosarcina sp.]